MVAIILTVLFRPGLLRENCRAPVWPSNRNSLRENFSAKIFPQAAGGLKMKDASNVKPVIFIAANLKLPVEEIAVFIIGQNLEAGPVNLVMSL